MNRKHFIVLLAVVFMFGPFQSALAINKKKKSSEVRLIEAWSQKTIPGIPDAQPKTTFNFIIKWSGRKYPETFFWRGENGWLPCNMLKAHKNDKKGEKTYKTEFVTGDKIFKGDTLQLTPMSGGRFPIPSEIPASAKNTLYYKTDGSGWLSFKVNTIVKKDDIYAP